VLEFVQGHRELQSRLSANGTCVTYKRLQDKGKEELYLWLGGLHGYAVISAALLYWL
jgi:hypothetical protein